MMYALTGNGAANPAEVIKSLELLWDADSARDDDFWLLFINEPSPTEVVQTVWEWANRTSVYYEVLTGAGQTAHPFLNKAETVHEMSTANVLAGVVEFVSKIDNGVLLILAGDTVDEQFATLIQQALHTDITVLDLASQLIQLELDTFTPEPAKEEIVSDTSAETPQEILDRLKGQAVAEHEHEEAEAAAEPIRKSGPRPTSNGDEVPEPQPAVDPLVSIPEPELSEMNRAQLKELIRSTKETVTAQARAILDEADLRSTTSMVNALLGRPAPPKKMNRNNRNYEGPNASPRVPKVALVPAAGELYFLKIVSKDGGVKEFPMTAEAAEASLKA